LSLHCGNKAEVWVALCVTWAFPWWTLAPSCRRWLIIINVDVRRSHLSLIRHKLIHVKGFSPGMEYDEDHVESYS
jgi:hypothetical protein